MESDNRELRSTRGRVVSSRRRTVQIVRSPSPSSREGTADSSQTRAGSECPAAPGNVGSMGLRELGRIRARARSECDSMPWARQPTPGTFYLYMRSGCGPLLLALRSQSYLVVVISVGIFISNRTRSDRKRKVTRPVCHPGSTFLITVLHPR